MELNLTGKVAVVTGAAQGIGRAIATRFAREGARVALLDVARDRLSATCEELREHGNAAAIYEAVCDVTDERQVQETFARLSDALGGLDILVNNAGITEPAPLEEMTLASWERVIAINLTAAFLTSKHAFAAMRQTGGGVILNIGSFAGKRGTLFGNNASYSASKAGIIGLTKALVPEGAPHGIRLVAVCPGIVDTEMVKAHSDETRRMLANLIPAGRFARPEEIAGVVVFLCSEQAAHVTGEVMDVNGGLYID